MIKIIGLIGGASGKELTEQLHNRGYEVALVAGKNGELGLDIADYVLTTDLKNVNTIESFFKDMHCRFVILGTGHFLAFKLMEELEKRGFISNVNIKASLIAKEKSQYKDLLLAKGFRTPAYVAATKQNELPNLRDVIERVGLPCVVKATIDTMLPQKVKNDKELRIAINEVLDSGSPVLIEQFIKGIDVTVPVAVANGIAKACGVCYYSKAEENELKGFSRNEYIKDKLMPENEAKVMAYCEQIALTSDFEGLPRVDAMVLPDGTTYVLEVNSVAVTGISDHHVAYCKYVVLFFKNNGQDLAKIAVDTALTKFGLA